MCLKLAHFDWLAHRKNGAAYGGTDCSKLIVDRPAAIAGRIQIHAHARIARAASVTCRIGVGIPRAAAL
jgi:hypothetical protein